LLELAGIRRLTKPLDPLSDLANGDTNENEPMPIEEGLDRTEPGEA
jgi:hypothetical protein